MEWMQALAIIVSMIGMIGGLGFFFLRLSERLDRNLEEMKRENKDFHERVSRIEGVIWTDIDKAIKKGK